MGNVGSSSEVMKSGAHEERDCAALILITADAGEPRQSLGGFFLVRRGRI